MQTIDTNVVVGFLVGDHPEQAARARALISDGAVFVPTTVMLEAAWVLRSAYGFATREVVDALRAFAGLPNVTLQEPERAGRALDMAAAGMDFADALHLTAAEGGFRTFDRRLLKRAADLGLPDVEAP
jgi:predicted nucleic acid-binding protein